MTKAAPMQKRKVNMPNDMIAGFCAAAIGKVASMAVAADEETVLAQ